MKSIKEIQDLLASWNTNPRKSLGQNFLIDEDAVAKISSKACEFLPYQLVEVGPGLGAITDELSKATSNIRLIEFDKYFADYWKEKNINVLQQDALKVDWENEFKQDYVLVSNLPYQISSSIVIDRSVKSSNCKAMILMFQKEVAQRIQENCGSKEYGLLSVISQSFWTVEKLLDAGPKCFYPAPKIASRVLVFVPKNVEFQYGNRKAYLQFVKFCFDQRRKKLLGRLKSQYSDMDWETIFINESIAMDIRPDGISVDKYLKIFSYF